MYKTAPIQLLITGGTIDGIDLEPQPGHKSSVAAYIKNKVKPYFDISEQLICFKDSRSVTDEDREGLLNAIASSAHSHFLITHGTFSMAQSAEYLLARAHLLKGRTIVFVGSFCLGLIDSDGPFNLGFAIASLNYLAEGIYIAMNGRIFPAGAVDKDLEQERFVARG
jgi:L-asparaginase